MSQVTIDTVAYPSWWSGASAVEITFYDNSTLSVNRTDLEFLPQGIATTGTYVRLVPWWFVKRIEKAS